MQINPENFSRIYNLRKLLFMGFGSMQLYESGYSSEEILFASKLNKEYFQKKLMGGLQ